METSISYLALQHFDYRCMVLQDQCICSVLCTYTVYTCSSTDNDFSQVQHMLVSVKSNWGILAPCCTRLTLLIKFDNFPSFDSNFGELWKDVNIFLLNQSDEIFSVNVFLMLYQKYSIIGGFCSKFDLFKISPQSYIAQQNIHVRDLSMHMFSI